MMTPRPFMAKSQINYQSPSNLHRERFKQFRCRKKQLSMGVIGVSHATDQRTDISGAGVELYSVILAVLEEIPVPDRS